MRSEWTILIHTAFSYVKKSWERITYKIWINFLLNESTSIKEKRKIKVNSTLKTDNVIFQINYLEIGGIYLSQQLRLCAYKFLVLPLFLNTSTSKITHTQTTFHQTSKIMSPSLSLLFFILLAPLLLLAQSPPPSSSPPSSSAACKTTLYPKLCRSMLSAIRSSPSDPYNYGKFSIKQNLKVARKLEKVFIDFLNRHQSSSSLNHEEIGALVDCKDLNTLNVDYLESISDELKSASSSSSSDTELVDKIESYLSAVATNHYTCYDGLVVTKSNIANALAVPLKDATQFYSVSLGLVTEALSKNMKRNKTRKHGLPNKSFKVRQPLEKLIKVMYTISLYHVTAFAIVFAFCVIN